MSAPQVVDLSTVKSAELAGLWKCEEQSWRERLFWDISDTLHRLQRVVERGDLPGKALRLGARTIGYAYYTISGHVGVISNFVISPGCGAAEAELLLHETVSKIRRTGVSRIESPFVSIDQPWLIPLFEREGFGTYWRKFLRRLLHAAPDQNFHPYPLPQDTLSRRADAPRVYLEPWRGSDLGEAASIMLAAYDGGIDAEINAQYWTHHGCEQVLGDILNQGACGIPVVEATAIARHRGRSIGFIILTEIAHRQAHLPQVAVLPEYQHQGVGRLVLKNAVSRLAERGFDTVSLIVSRPNRRALSMYQAMGFQSVLSFPVFVWQVK